MFYLYLSFYLFIINKQQFQKSLTNTWSFSLSSHRHSHIGLVFRCTNPWWTTLIFGYEFSRNSTSMTEGSVRKPKDWRDMWRQQAPHCHGGLWRWTGRTLTKTEYSTNSRRSTSCLVKMQFAKYWHSMSVLIPTTSDRDWKELSWRTWQRSSKSM